MSDNASFWFSTYGLPQNGKARAFAFPCSGAGTMSYYQWAKYLDGSEMDFVGVQLPGRENRLREKPIADLPLLLESLVPAISPWLGKPFVFFGHSMGALIAFELCRALCRKGLPLPQRLFVSAFRSPQMPNPNRELHKLPDLGIIDSLRKYGGTPVQVLANKELMAVFLPVLRADFSLHETYRYQEEAPLPCPITALAGAGDKVVRPEYMVNWRQQTTSGFELVQYEGGHFFLHGHMDAIMQRLRHPIMALSCAIEP